MIEWWHFWKRKRICSCASGYRCFVCCQNLNPRGVVLARWIVTFDELHAKCTHKRMDKRPRKLIKAMPPIEVVGWKA